jgi:small subunit ribosomal protein S8
MNHDTLANGLSKLMNYEKIGRQTVTLYPASVMIKDVVVILQKAGFVGEATSQDTTRGTVVTVPLLGAINSIGVIKPRFAVQRDAFEKFEKRFLPARGVGVIIISTSKGLMSLEEAKKENIGGRLIAYCY